MTTRAGQRLVPAPASSPARTLNVKRALACFAAAYVLVTVLASGLTMAYATIRNTAAADELETNPVEKPSFATTVPYHVLVMLLIWPLFAWLYFRYIRPGLREAAVLSIVWVVAAMLVDLVAFVVTPNAWSLTPHQFYVDYQPWISLIYLAILASPWIYLLLAPSGRKAIRARGNTADSPVPPKP